MIAPRPALASLAALWLLAGSARAELPSRPSVVGKDILTVELKEPRGEFHAAAWDDLVRAARTPGSYTVRIPVGGSEAIELPVCAGRGKIAVDGVAVPSAPGPLLVHPSAGA